MSSITVNILLAVFLLAANAFYVAAEFALVKSRGFRVKAMAERNSFGAQMLLRMMGDIEAIYSYEGSYGINALIVGRALTGVSAFV